MITSPTDIDEKTNEVFTTAFEKAYDNGLSVFRASATDDDVTALVTDVLTIKHGMPRRKILALFEMQCLMVRSISHGEMGLVFCVYDQTVPRRRDPHLPHIPTHATIFQRVPRPKLEGRRKMMEEANYELFRQVSSSKVSVEGFRQGLIVSLNQRSLDGEFELPAEPQSQSS